MYQNCCKKCGSIALHTEVKGNNTGLYCDDCGAWIKWLGKDELNAFSYAKEEENRSVVHNYSSKLDGGEISRVLDCLIGETEPTGDSDEDRNRLENTYKLWEVARHCINILMKTEEYSTDERGSVYKIGRAAHNALEEIYDSMEFK